ncbi:MAG TPA: MerR family transcriptional regulator [Candidatus Pullichristensenella avicola]|nr:MerR family transcriptional regulator [Candidatus Pullichristensenella avicola]
MKDICTIHEIAALYGVGPDALRYYERLGLIRPRRAQNGYRIYDLNDIYRLTIIRDLRSLGFSMERIGEYLQGLSVANTLQLLEEERQLIRARIRDLRAAERAIRMRASVLERYAHMGEGEASLVDLPPRPCLRLNADISRDEEMDFAIKRLHRRHADSIRDLGGQKIGASMSPEDLRAGRIGLYRSVFFLLDGEGAGDFTLPGGRYARLFYRGSYRRLGQHINALLSWVRGQNLFPTGDVLEIYHIDNRFTKRDEEFFTELQVRMEEREAWPLG